MRAVLAILLALLMPALPSFEAEASARARRKASAKLAKKRPGPRKKGKGATRARRIAQLDREKVPQDGQLRVRGRVLAHTGKPITVAIYREYPRTITGDATANTPVMTSTVGGDGRFLIEGAKAGQYWVAAFVDDNGDGRWQVGRELGAVAAPTNPIEIDEVRDFMTVEIELDPLYVELRTRFIAGTREVPARHVYDGVRVMIPGAGNAEVPAKDVHVTTPLGEAKPGAPVAARYFVEVSHPTLGESPVKRMVLPANFGALPVIVTPREGEPAQAGRDLQVSWKLPAWGNDTRLILVGQDGKVAFSTSGVSPLVVPGAVLVAGQRYRLSLEAARISVQQSGVAARSSGSADRILDVVAP